MFCGAFLFGILVDREIRFLVTENRALRSAEVPVS